MKKTFTACLLACLLYTPCIIKAFELPAILESNTTDHIIQWGGNFLNRFKQEGAGNFFFSANVPRLVLKNKVHFRLMTAGGVQFATPLIEKMVSKHYLYRFEFNALGIIDDIETLKKGKMFYLLKFGLSGRHFLTPHFIAGGYLFYDQFFWFNQSVSASWTTNLGIEGIWPRYASAVTVDSVFNPANLLGDANSRFYKTSFKYSILKPKIFDIFCGASFTKNPYYPREWLLTPLYIKFRVPTNKWNINKRLMVGIGTNYVKRPDIAWISPRNLGICFYIQFNFLKDNPQNSPRDYLRMPIDRYFATPWHPDQHHYNQTPPTTPLEQSQTLPKRRSYQSETTTGPIIMMSDCEDTDDGASTPSLQNASPFPMSAQPSKEELRKKTSFQHLKR